MIKEITLYRQIKSNIEGDWWECSCGNQPDYEGFYACDQLGNPQHDEGGSPDDKWDTTYYYCNKCKAVINQYTTAIIKEGVM